MVVARAVDRARPEAEDEADHPGLRVDARVPGPRVVRERDAGRLREEQVAVHRARHALHEDRHLLVAVEQPAVLAVAQRLLAHGARVDLPDRRLERGEARLRRALVRAEHAVVLPRERVAESVLEQR